ncbi:alpha/beta hydrolase [Streptomyces sp. NPDC046866]|uniref:alpha/beta fold hydrolase n=1 Tax=Streptomyces sp. NPDC046866 TaxID=3154921 RepID=UPI0034567DDA
MPRARVNGVELFYETEGPVGGEPLVLVHGSWSDHLGWRFVLPRLARTYRVLAYDRRGHSRSERPAGPGSRREDEADLAALIEMLGSGPVHVAASSFGASTALGLAARRPGLLRSIMAHEPPLVAVVADRAELRPVLEPMRAALGDVLAALRSGGPEAAARQFVEDVAVGPGAWEQLPDPVRRTFADNAPTFADEQADPDWAVLDVGRLGGFTGPVLLTTGTESPPWFPAILDGVAGAFGGRVEQYTFEGAGHVPHLTHPEAYADRLETFIAGQSAVA